MADVWTTSESIETLPTNLIEINNTYDLNEFLEENDWPINSLGPKRDSLYVVIPITIIYAIIFFTGVIGNVSTCIVISRNKSMHTATNYYLFSLAVSDLLLLVSGLPQEMYSIWSRYPYVFGEIFCVLRGLAAETSANATVLTITAFTVERYVAICHPFLSHTMSKLSRAIKLILSIWVVALCFAIPQALQFGVINKPEVLCVVKRTLIDHSFELSTFLFFIAPMTLITVLYALIGLRLRSSNIMKRDRHNTVSCREQTRCQDANGSNDEYRRSCRHQHGQSSKRVLKMLVAVVVAFFICWAPFHAQRLVAIYVDDTHTNHTNMKVYEIVTYISGILYYVSTTVNPVLYHIMSNKFREAFKETFARCCGRRRTKRRSYSILSRSQALQSQQKYAGTGSEHRSGRCQTHESTTDSGTSITNRHSEDSTCFHPAGERSALSQQCRRENPDQSLADKSIHHNQMESNCVMARSNLNTSNLSVSKRKLNTRTARFLRAFHCLAKRTLDDKFQSSGYPSPVIEDHITKDSINNKIDESYCMVSCNVSNSSLKDIENGALEDELTTYMREIHNRELTNS